MIQHHPAAWDDPASPSNLQQRRRPQQQQRRRQAAAPTAAAAAAATAATVNSSSTPPSRPLPKRPPPPCRCPSILTSSSSLSPRLCSPQTWANCARRPSNHNSSLSNPDLNPRPSRSMTCSRHYGSNKFVDDIEDLCHSRTLSHRQSSPDTSPEVSEESNHLEHEDDWKGRSDNGVGNALRFVPEDVAPTLPIIADADNQVTASSCPGRVSEACASTVQTDADIDMNNYDSEGNQVEQSVSHTGHVVCEPSSSMQNLGDAQNGNQADHAVSNSGPSENTIDPTVLEALPEGLLTEVLASQQAQPVQPHDNLSHLRLTDPVRAAVLCHHTAVANPRRLSSAFSA
ncbi:hypothetical protein MLD38_036782 [Melastoma candidum]|uniref:Uncharacterized protein n=1 Tax=Melastoma candidum TaxID=119954 RepID=A0ACB9LLR4_9MYRT|nr:hypothetical protein MLD38_036782 [Melastoma candidum]